MEESLPLSPKIRGAGSSPGGDFGSVERMTLLAWQVARPFIRRSRVRAQDLPEPVAGDDHTYAGALSSTLSSLPSAVAGSVTPATNEASNLGVVHR